MIPQNGTESKEEKTSPAEELGEKIYEVGYLLKPSLPPEDAPISHDAIKEIVLSSGGAVVSEEMPRTIALSYPMSKIENNTRTSYRDAHFGWIKFELLGGKIGDARERISQLPEILRFLLVKTVRANTVAARRFSSRDFKRRAPFSRKEEGNESPAASSINKEEIDKEIEAMVSGN